MNAHREVVVRIQQPAATRDDAVTVVIGIAGPGYVVEVFVRDHACHRERGGAVHADAAVQSRVMKRKVGSV